MAVTEIFTTNKNVVSIKEMEQSEEVLRDK